MGNLTYTRLIAIDAEHPDPETIQLAAEQVQKGGLVAFPTETVYGLGANALDASAIGKIYSAKGRPSNNPLIAHIATLEQIEQVAVDIPETAYQLAAYFWPGPLTLVLPRHERVPDVASAGRDTVAVRFPAHPVARALIKAAGVPIVAPSANRFTRPSATTAQHVLADLNGRVDIILDGGPTHIGVESTVLDLTAPTPIVLRPGGVTLEALQTVLPEILAPAQHVPMDDAEARPASPGMLIKHYSPNAEVLVFDGEAEAVTRRMRETASQRMADGQRVGLLLTDEDRPAFADLPVVVQPLGAAHDLAHIAQQLFAGLRALDAQQVDVILARQFPAEGMGRAIADRLLRAAEGRVIEVE
ncbi:MAG: threonylcarbamoyl-AMP synthase [Anaerolineae bacterium]|nr:threonylcarbamoyl-AMP synthase [Anaerolineae bacterium]